MYPQMACNNRTREHELLGLCWNAIAGRNEDTLNDLRQWFYDNQNNKELIKDAAVYTTSKGINNWTPLHVILQSRPPADVIEQLIRCAAETVRMKDTEGLLPLHHACWNGASVEVVSILVKAYPEGVTVADNIGTLPIHCACYRGSSLDVLALLIHAFPHSITVKDNFGWLPLHWACYRGASLDVLNVLIDAYPDSLDIEVNNKRPSVYLKDSAKHHDDSEGKFLLHNAIASAFSVHLVKLLLESFPESSMIKDEDGKTPLHHACASENVNSMDVVMVLANANTEEIYKATDNHGRTPSNLLQPVASLRDPTGRVPLHRQAAFSKFFTVRSLILLFSAYPESIAEPDNLKMLPFHHACLNSALPLDVLMHFLKLYPESIKSQ